MTKFQNPSTIYTLMPLMMLFLSWSKSELPTVLTFLKTQPMMRFAKSSVLKGTRAKCDTQQTE